MGSSPVTATISPPARRRVADAVAHALAAAGARPGDLLLAAFSGGPDSTALLIGLADVATGGDLRLLAGHVDHGLDGGSAARADAAVALAGHLGVPCERLVAPPSSPARGEALPRRVRPRSPEARARALRYALLEQLAAARGARFLLTAHHADDQAETVLLRLLQGSGLAGLAAIQPRRGALLRPLLALRRAELAACVGVAGVAALADPTNDDVRVPRNRLRHHVLPALGPAAAAAALGVATAAARLADGLERRLADLFPALGGAEAPSLDLATLAGLPAELLPWALAALHRRSGLPYPPPAGAVAELRRRLATEAPVAGLDCGGGARWESAGGALRAATGRAARNSSFFYTVDVPGRVEIRETGTTFRLTRQPVAAWMWHGSPERAALDLPLAAGQPVSVRSRRPGDRLQPLGSPYRRRLKDVLIDRKVPRAHRDRLPLLCLGEQVAWVPGVTIHEPFRLRPGATSAWVAELLPAPAALPSAGG